MQSRPGFGKSEQARMLLSRETMFGFRMTGKYLKEHTYHLVIIYSVCWPICSQILCGPCTVPLLCARSESLPEPQNMPRPD